MAFRNRIRLPFNVRRPQFPEEAVRFRNAGGVTKTISVVIRKTYIGETDYLSEKIHERLKVALAHDIIFLEGFRYAGEVNQEGDYSIDWPQFKDYPIAKAEFAVEVNPFSATNNNCVSCEELTQVVANNDAFYSPLNEGEEYEINVANNDEICCSPVTFSIVTFNSALIEDVTIDEQGVITFTTKTDLRLATSVNLLTYRVTCPNGAYDEADVYADINGTVVDICAVPDNVQYTLEYMGEDEVLFTWDDVVDGVDYYWELYSNLQPGVPIQTGTVSDNQVIIGDLPTDLPATYTFYVRANCSGDDPQSGFSNGLSFNKSAQGNGCGYYKFTYTGNPANIGVAKPISYIDCFSAGSEIVNNSIYSTLAVCLLESSPGVPLYWAAQDVAIEFLGDCVGEGNMVNNKVSVNTTFFNYSGVSIKFNNESTTVVNNHETKEILSGRPITKITIVIFFAPGTGHILHYTVKKRSDNTTITSGSVSSLIGYVKIITLSVNEAVEVILT